MSRIIGYYIQKTWKDCPIGKTMCSYLHTLYPDKARAQQVLDELDKDSRFHYDVVPVFWGTLPSAKTG